MYVGKNLIHIQLKVKTIRKYFLISCTDDGVNLALTYAHTRVCVLFQYGPYSDVSEITTAAGPPGQCKAPCISFTPDGCVLVSWEVSQARVLHRFLFLLLCHQMQVTRNLQG